MRLRVPPLAFVTCLAAMPAFAACQFDRAAIVLPLRSAERPVIDATIDGHPVQVAVDTGAEASSLTPETVESLGLRRDPTRQTRVISIGGEAVSRNAVVPTLGIGNLAWSRLSVAVAPLDGAKSSAGLAGLVGADLLSAFDLELDIPRRTLTLYRPTGCVPPQPPWDQPYQSLPTTMSSRRKVLLPVFLNGHPITAMFDTGSRGETISRAAASDIGVTDAQLESDPQSTGTSAGLHSYKIRRHRFDEFQVGKETFHGTSLDVVDFHQSGVDMLIGVDYMHWRRFFISYSADMLFIQRQPGLQAQAGVPAADGKPDPCRPSADVLARLSPTRPVATSRARIGAPAKAQADHVQGCAAVLFHLSPDGTPVDVRLVTESPTGYGLGDVTLRELTATRFQPLPPETKWFYEVHRFRS